MTRVLGIAAVLVGLLASIAITGEHLVGAEPATGDGEIIDEAGSVWLTVDLSRPVPWRVWIEDEPPSLVLELSDFVWSDLPRQRSSSIATLEAQPTGATTTELRAILREPLSLVTAEMVTPENGGAVLQVALQPATAVEFKSGAQAADQEGTAIEEHLVVAIDPGHGGRDPGAQSGALNEADLVLAFSQRLVPLLEATGRFDATLTRETDEFVSLDQRLSRARAAGADVLISIHADALEDANAASGLVIYSLSNGASAAADERLVERHDGTERIGGVNLTDAGDDVSLALLEMVRRDTTPRTAALSSALFRSFESAELALNSRPERHGAFTVLKAADVPSVLIELGFLSTQADLERLTSDAWQISAAEAIRDALLLWSDEDRLR